MSLLFKLLVNGAIPFVTTPTLYQAVWATGFSETYTHGGIYNICAFDTGFPHSATIEFGLAATWPISLLLRLGIEAPDAYTIIFRINKK